MSFIDPCPNLSLAVDVAGDKYFLGTERPVELGYKSRKDFLNAFGTDPNIMCLLRKYMFYGNDLLKTVFDSTEERQLLIQILEKRANFLRTTQQFSSSIIANTFVQRNYVALLKLIEGLKGEPYVPRNWGLLKDKLAGVKGLVPNALLPTAEYKKYAMGLTDDQKLQLVLEMSWYLMNPELVPKKAQRQWYKIVKQLDLLRVDDMARLNQTIKTMMVNNPQKPLINYFQSMNLKKLMEINNLNSIEPATLEQVFLLGCEKDKQTLEERLRAILQILAIKKYLSSESVSVLYDIRSNNSDIMADLSGSIVENPGKQQGGASAEEDRELSSQLQQSLSPFFDYFGGLYDPIYSVLETAINQFNKNSEDKPNLEELVKLLQIVSRINPENDPKKYGVYRLAGLSPTVVQFVQYLIKYTQQHTDVLDDREKEEYFEDLLKLPHVRLSSVVKSNNSIYKDPDTLPFISLMLVGAGITIPSEESIDDPNKGFIRKSMDSHGVSSSNKTLSSLNFKQVHGAIQEYFVEGELYIVCNSENNKLPLVLYEINIDEVKLDDNVVTGTLLENNYFNKLMVGNEPLYMDDLLLIDNTNIVNDSSLALAVFISFKGLFN